MAGEKNFNVKNGLSVAGTEVIQSDGTYVGSISATALASPLFQCDALVFSNLICLILFVAGI